MWIERLGIDAVRCWSSAVFDPSPGLNLFIGPNGAGKTSVLEAVHLVATGRSFRSGGPRAYVQRGRQRAVVHAVVRTDAGREARGMERGLRGWQGRRNGRPVTRLGEWVRGLAVLIVEPESHALLSGGSSERRRLLDWLVFHVEPNFIDDWRAYQRALEQRNEALKRGSGDRELRPWEEAMAIHGTRVHAARAATFARWRASVLACCTELVPELGPPEVQYLPGWDTGGELLEALIDDRARARAVGFSTVGPHRADWSLVTADRAGREHWSRGQQKTLAIACIEAVVRVYRAEHGETPILGLDDLFSELDLVHQRRCLERVGGLGAQIWVTGTQISPALEVWSRERRLFHVEPGGRIATLV